MLVPADAVTAPHCATRTISFLADSTSLLAVIFSDTLVLAMRLRIAVLVFVHAGRCISWAGVGLASLPQSGEAAVLEQTALGVVSSSELDESLVSPGAAPGVLHQDEFGGVSYSGNGVVWSSSASVVLDDSSSVLLEFVGHLEGNRQRSGSQSFNVSRFSSANTGVTSDESSDPH